MTNPHIPEHVWASVLPVCNGRGVVIGSGAVVAPQLVLTALHVVDHERFPHITEQFPVTAVVSLRPWQFGPARRVARLSYRRTRVLSGHDDHAVDLALLAVPDLVALAIETRSTPVHTGELVTVAGYPLGRPTASHGPITSTDEADFVAHVSLGPGISGAPAIDQHGRLAGVITMDHTTAGAIAIGPAVLTAFVDHASWHLKERDIDPRHIRATCR